MPAEAGQLALLRFPNTDLRLGKPRPVLLVTRTPSPYNDWLLAMISTQLDQALQDFDEVILEEVDDFERSGLKLPSVIRLSRLAVVNESVLLGKLGTIAPERLHRVRKRLTEWIGAE